MEIRAVHGSLTEQSVDALIVNLFEGVKVPGGGTGAVDRAMGGLISRTIQDEDFAGKLGQILVLRGCGDMPAKKVLVVGLGKQEKFGSYEIMRASAAAIRKCRGMRARSVGSILHGAGIAGLPAIDCAKAVTLGTLLGAYEFTRLKSRDNNADFPEYFAIVEMSSEKLPHIRQGIQHAKMIGSAVSFARDLVNEPSNVVTPEYLSEIAREMAASKDLQCNVLDRAGIEDARMGLLAAVARGSRVEPRFIELRYQSPNASRTVALIGKGVTFDTGGYSLKTSESMYGMKDDMAGAAAVLAAMRAVADLRPAINVIALIPATENSIGGSAIHPGDVFTSLSGKTVEVNNTDAEGRLILSDAVAYARNAGVDEIIDLATLTGACVTALGREIAGVFGSDQQIVDSLIEAGERCGEKLWQLPLYSDYRDSIKSDVADIKNTGGREGGAIVGALFIESFVGDTPWAHIDLSSSMVKKDTHLAKKGATGVGTGTLIEYLINRAGTR